MYKSSVIINLAIEGLHCWRDIPKEGPLNQVGFLSAVHRHTFTIKAKKEVSHDDRDIEIILFKRAIRDYLRSKYYDEELDCLMFNSMSCEMIARELLQVFGLDLCEVLEDGENGGEVVREQIAFPQVVLVCGYPCSGKNTFIKANLKGYHHIVVSDIVKSVKNSSDTRELNNTKNLTEEIGNKLIQEISRNSSKRIVIDGLRQIELYCQVENWCLTHLRRKEWHSIWLEVPFEERKERYERRSRKTDNISYEEVCVLNDELGLLELKKTLISDSDTLIINH